MAITSFVSGNTKIRGRKFIVYARATAAWTVPANKSAHDTLISGLTKIGDCAADSVEVKLEPGESFEGTESGTKHLTKKGSFSADVAQLDDTNIGAMESVDGTALDFILVSTAGDLACCVKNITYNYQEAIKGKSVQVIPIRCEKEVSTALEFREWYDIPTT